MIAKILFVRKMHLKRRQDDNEGKVDGKKRVKEGRMIMKSFIYAIQ